MEACTSTVHPGAAGVFGLGGGGAVRLRPVGRRGKPAGEAGSGTDRAVELGHFLVQAATTGF